MKMIIITVRNSSQSFLSDTRQEINIGMKKKYSNDCLINLKKDDWMFKKDVKTPNQPQAYQVANKLFLAE